MIKLASLMLPDCSYRIMPLIKYFFFGGVEDRQIHLYKKSMQVSGVHKFQLRLMYPVIMYHA